MTVSNITKKLKGLSKEWVQVASLLNLPASVISTINAVISHQPDMGDEDALYKVIAWWFVNTASPEWTAIDGVVDQLSKGNNRSLTGV